MSVSTRRTVRLAALTFAVLPVVSLAACGGGSDPLATNSSSAADATGSSSSSGGAVTVKVGAADYSESQILAAIYVGALKAKGINASASRQRKQPDRLPGGLPQGVR